ncbi:MAG: hypothetical protein H5T64_07485 [Chloroflexi bacterium]|nr:hypothetical protein [Chloroflexota bacterium]
MNLEEAIRLLNWLEEERRKDKALLSELQATVKSQSIVLEEQTQRLQSLQGEMTRLQGELARYAQFEAAIQNLRAELANQVEGLREERRISEEQKAREAKALNEQFKRTLATLQHKVDAMPEFERAIEPIRLSNERLINEVGRLAAQAEALASQNREQNEHIALLLEFQGSVNQRLTNLEQRVDTLSRKGSNHDERLAFLMETVGGANQRLGEVQEAVRTLRARADALESRMDSQSTRYDQHIGALREAFDVNKREQAQALESMQLALQRMKTMITETDATVAGWRDEMANWRKQYEMFLELYERNKKTLFDLLEIEKSMRQQQDEMRELQRVATERQKNELLEWQDRQAKLDGAQDERLSRLERGWQEISANLDGLHADLNARAVELSEAIAKVWQAWRGTLQEQIELYNRLMEENRER